MAAAIACDTYPSPDRRAFRRLRDDLTATAAQTDPWSAHRIAERLAALGGMIAAHGGGVAYGGMPTLADGCPASRAHPAEPVRVDPAPLPPAGAGAGALPAVAPAHPVVRPGAPPV